MGNIIFFQSSEHEIGNVGKGRWREMRRLLPALVEYLNASTTDRDRDTFELTRIFRDESDFRDEVYIDDASELLRLFKRFSSVSERDSSAGFYAPLIEELRLRTQGIERFTTARAELKPPRPQLLVFVDVDDTLVRSVGSKRIPIPTVIQRVRDLHASGARLYCWSSGGAEYAKSSAVELGLVNCFTGFLPKPQVMVDDQPPAEWRNLKCLHPNEISSLGLAEIESMASPKPA